MLMLTVAERGQYVFFTFSVVVFLQMKCYVFPEHQLDTVLLDLAAHFEK